MSILCECPMVRGVCRNEEEIECFWVTQKTAAVEWTNGKYGETDRKPFRKGREGNQQIDINCEPNRGI